MEDYKQRQHELRKGLDVSFSEKSKILSTREETTRQNNILKLEIAQLRKNFEIYNTKCLEVVNHIKSVGNNPDQFLANFTLMKGIDCSLGDTKKNIDLNGLGLRGEGDGEGGWIYGMGLEGWVGNDSEIWRDGEGAVKGIVREFDEFVSRLGGRMREGQEVKRQLEWSREKLASTVKLMGGEVSG